eukprot:UN14793
MIVKRMYLYRCTVKKLCTYFLHHQATITIIYIHVYTLITVILNKR